MARVSNHERPGTGPGGEGRKMRTLVVNRPVTSAALSLGTGVTAIYRLPFPEQNGLLQLVLLQKPALFYGIKYAYLAMLFSTPYILFSILLSVAYIFFVRQRPCAALAKLPLYPEA